MILDWIKKSFERFLKSRRTKRKKRRGRRKASRRGSKRRSKKPIQRGHKARKQKQERLTSQRKPLPPRPLAKAVPVNPSQSPRGFSKRYQRNLRPASSRTVPTRPASSFPRRAPGASVLSGAKAGTITHYFGKIQVAVLTVERALKTGDKVDIRRKGLSVGKDSVRSMQINHIPIDEARKGEEIGLKLLASAQPGDEIFIL